MIALAAALLVAASPEVPNRYQVRLTGDLRTARVEARVRVRGGALAMADWGFPEDLPLGWATFVEGLEVTREGAAVAVTAEPPGRWKVDVPDGTALDLRYTVRLGHDAHPWDAAGGADARPAVIGDVAVVWITRALFVLGDEDRAPAAVTFSTPAGWRLSTPWRPVPGEAGAFAPDDLADLFDAVVVAGRHLEREVTSGPMTVVVAADPALAPALPLVARTLEGLLAEYRRVFGRLPAARYLVALRKDALDDGEAFPRSLVQLFRAPDLAGGAVVWANVLAHELFHLWSPGRLPPADPRAAEWFKEGFTEYYANRSLARIGAISAEDWRRKVGFHLSRYWSARHMSPPPRPGLEEAGRSKMANWRLVYGGGATLALLLDVELRAAGHPAGLDAVMRALEERYARTGEPFSTADLLAALAAAGHPDPAAFHAAYVAGASAWPPVEGTLRAAGLRVHAFADEFHLAPDPAAGPRARALRASLLGKAARAGGATARTAPPPR